MKNIKQGNITAGWQLIDAKDKVLGRLASEIATILRGKNKSYFTPHLDAGDNVVVINAKNVFLSGKKENQKIYYKHSGFQGGLKEKTAAQMRTIKPEFLIRHAVIGMLPKTKLSKNQIKKLFIFENTENPYADKFSKN